MRPLVLCLVLSGCAAVGPSDDGPGGSGGELGSAADLSMSGGGPDLSLPGGGPDLFGQDLFGAPDLRAPADLSGGGPGYSYPRINEVVASAGGVPANEYIELIGANHDIDLSGWQIMNESKTGPVSLVTLNGLTLPQGGYVVIAADKGSYAATADAVYATTASGSLTQAGGGVGLINAAGMLVDGLAWGTTTGAFVEGTPAVIPGDLSVSRIPDGVDTNNNRADAQKAALTPRAANHP